MARPVDDEIAKKVASQTADDLSQRGKDTVKTLVTLNRKNHEKLQELVGDRKVSQAINIVVKHLIVELSKRKGKSGD